MGEGVTRTATLEIHFGTGGTVFELKYPRHLVFFGTKLSNLRVRNICESMYANNVRPQYTQRSEGWLFSLDFRGNCVP